MRRIADPAAHRQNLFQRAREMLAPKGGGNGLLEELAAAWMIEPQHDFIASVNGLEAVVAWCQRHQISPAQLERAKLSEATLIDLAHAITDAHLVHVQEQVTAFQELFRSPSIRHVSTEALLTTVSMSLSTPLRSVP